MSVCGRENVRETSTHRRGAGSLLQFGRVDGPACVACAPVADANESEGPVATSSSGRFLVSEFPVLGSYAPFGTHDLQLIPARMAPKSLPPASARAAFDLDFRQPSTFSVRKGPAVRINICIS